MKGGGAARARRARSRVDRLEARRASSSRAATPSRAARRRRGARGTSRPVRLHAGDGDVVAADHEVDVDRARVDAVAVLVADRDRVGVAEREVARGVLVEQRVEEDRAGLADPSFAVDERELAEP